MSDALVQFFTQIPVFAELTPDELGEIVRAMQPRRFDPGEFVYRKGDPADGMYIVQSGEVDVLLPQLDGSSVHVRTLGQGEVIGEIGLLDKGTRSATIRAKDEAELVRLDGLTFDRLRAERRPAAYKIVRAVTLSVCQRFRAVDAEIRRSLAPSEEDSESKAGRPSGVTGWFRKLLVWKER